MDAWLSRGVGRDGGGDVGGIGQNARGTTVIWWPPTELDKERRKESTVQTFSTDRALRWQGPDAATQSPVDYREVQILSSCDRTRPVNPDRTQPESGRSCIHLLRLTERRTTV